MTGGAGGQAQAGSTILGWTQLVANVAAALALVMAAYQFYANTKAQRIQNSLTVLSDGRQLDQQYRAGQAAARDIVTLYYRVYVSRSVLEQRIVHPLERSLCSAMSGDPRVREYWNQTVATDEKYYFVGDFVERMNQIMNKKASCE